MHTNAFNVDEVRKINLPLSDFDPLKNWIIPQPTIAEYKQMFNIQIKPGMVMLAGILPQKFKFKDGSSDPYNIKCYIQLSDVSLDTERNLIYRTQGFQIVQINYPKTGQPSLLEDLVEGDRICCEINPQNPPIGETVFNIAHSDDITESVFKHGRYKGFVYNALIIWIDQIYAKHP